MNQDVTCSKKYSIDIFIVVNGKKRTGKKHIGKKKKTHRKKPHSERSAYGKKRTWNKPH